MKQLRPALVAIISILFISSATIAKPLRILQVDLINTTAVPQLNYVQPIINDKLKNTDRYEFIRQEEYLRALKDRNLEVDLSNLDDVCYKARSVPNLDLVLSGTIDRGEQTPNTPVTSGLATTTDATLAVTYKIMRVSTSKVVAEQSLVARASKGGVYTLTNSDLDLKAQPLGSAAEQLAGQLQRYWSSACQARSAKITLVTVEGILKITPADIWNIVLGTQYNVYRLENGSERLLGRAEITQIRPPWVADLVMLPEYQGVKAQAGDMARSVE